VAVVATALAVAGALAIDLPLDIDTNLLLLAAVSVTAWYGGRGPGVVAALLSAVAISTIFIPHSVIRAPRGVGEEIYVAAFLGVSIVVSTASEALHRARRTAEERVLDLQEALTKLELHTEEVESLSDHLQETNDALSESIVKAERLADQATSLQSITRALSQARTTADVIRVALDRGLALVRAKAGIVATLENGRFTSVDSAGYSEALTARLRELTTTDEAPVSRAARTSLPIWLSSPNEYRQIFPTGADLFHDADQGAWLAFPLVSGGETIGAIEVAFADATGLGAPNIAFGELLAQTVAEALARARTFDAERAGRREAELQAKARAEVLGVVAHDLRNPIHSIVAGAELLLEDDLTAEKRHEIVEISRRAAHRMNRLVGDLLDATQLQAGRMSLRLNDVDAATILRDIGEAWRYSAGEKNLALEIVVPTAPLSIHADPERVVQALGNLVGNALKFTPSGGRVTVSALDAVDAVEFSVKDTGPGIRPEVTERLFDRFWQENIGDRRGIGLGLAIAKGIVEAHGGHIGVRSTPGAGATFSFTIPKGRVSMQGRRSTDGDHAGSSQSAKARVEHPPAHD